METLVVVVDVGVEVVPVVVMVAAFMIELAAESVFCATSELRALAPAARLPEEARDIVPVTPAPGTLG